MSKKAKAHLCLDPRFKEIIESTTLRRRVHSGDVYATLVRTIIYQQLSGKAAGTIHGRFLELFDEGYPEPRQLVRLKAATLRKVGLSYQKGGYVQNVARFWIDHQADETDWKQLSEDEIIAFLTQIKGVGVWSVQMLLMFTLKRPDVFPIGDLGVRNAVVKKYRLRSKGKALDKRILKIAERWRPYRTLASLYLWSWLDNS